MKKLEEEIRQKMIDYSTTANGDGINFYAKAAAEVSKRYIEKAWNDAWKLRDDASTFIETFPEDHPETIKNKDQWIKENL
jgi:hypothetical protein